MTVQVNNPAPAFELSGVVGKQFQEVKLSDYTGKWAAYGARQRLRRAESQ